MVHVAMFLQIQLVFPVEGLGIATIIFKKSKPLNKSTYQYIIGLSHISPTLDFFT